MSVAANAIHEMQGGLVAVNEGEVIAKMYLPIGGLMSEKPADEVMAEISVANEAARDLGCVISAPYMILSFISLPTVHSLGLTDMGLIDVIEHKLIEVEILD